MGSVGFVLSPKVCSLKCASTPILVQKPTPLAMLLLKPLLKAWESLQGSGRWVDLH